MALENISRRSYPEADRNEVQEQTARAIESDPEPFFVRYHALSQSFEGRYVCSDLFKETFSEFSASNEARGRYNNPLHNCAAVLASEQFRRRAQDASKPEQDTVIFLTGVPGPGKTTAILSEAQLESNVRMVYEGQLARPDSVIPKIEQVLAAGLRPVIVAVHTPAEVALVNTLRRYERHGRGASVEAMASIQGGLSQGLAAIRERFGDQVEFQLFDRRRGLDQTQQKEGWQHAGELQSEGTYEHLKARLHAALDQHEAAGVFRADAIAQARGLVPLARDHGLAAPDGGQPQHARSRGSEGPAQDAVAAPIDTARAESAQARGIEAEQARLRDQSIGGRYQAALQTYLQANAQRIGRIEDRLETLIENQQAALGEWEAQRPGFFSAPGTKAAWAANREASQDRLQTLQGRLARVEELREQSAELAEDKMRDQEPELAGAWDEVRRAQRGQEQERRRERQVTRDKDRSRNQGRELEL